MAELSCTLEEFNRIIGPKIRNDVQYVTKKPKSKLGLVYEHCGNKAKELDAAHKHDYSKEKIIKSTLEDYKTKNDEYVIPNLDKVLDKIKEQHKSEKVFFFLCKKCHNKYDQSNKIKNSKENLSKGITRNLDDLKQVILTIFKENSDKFFTPSMMYEIIQERNTKYYADTLWGLEKKGFLIHPQRGHYKWNEKQ